MIDYRYKLEKYSGRNSRYECPQCGKTNQFSKYIDIETGAFLANNVGKCNRIDKCGYHYTPQQYFDENGIEFENTVPMAQKPQPVHQPPSFIDTNTFNNSLKRYESNVLVNYLDTLFNPEIVNHLINIYKIGTSSRYNGGTTVFWQIDNSDNVRTGKLIKYDKTGHRIKGCNNWVHSVQGLHDYNLEQCLFGEHLLKHAPDYSIGIVESEKTAIIMAAAIPNLLWLATGGAEGINENKVKVLNGRKVILFPDASSDSKIYEKWKQKANKFEFEISDYLEKISSKEQKFNGVDIADFINK
jgi:hypothetical protein